MIKENEKKKVDFMSGVSFYAYWRAHNVNPHPHLHEKYEIYISLNSKGDFFLQETKYPLQIGRVFLIKPFQIHHGFSAHGEDTSRYCIRFSTETLESLSTRETNLVQLFQQAPETLLLQRTDLVQVASLAEQLIADPPETYGGDLERQLVFVQILLLFARILHQIGPVKEKNLSDSDETVAQILNYIYKNYQQEISLDEMAGKLYLSKSRLCKIFKEHTGFTIGNYLTMYRLQRACRLLEKGGRVKDVGKAVGFQTYTHFIRTFTSKLGVSPKKFMGEHVTELPEDKNAAV